MTGKKKTQCSICEKMFENIYCGYCRESVCEGCTDECYSCNKYREDLKKVTDDDPDYAVKRL